MDIKQTRGKYGVSLRELEHVSGIPRPTIHAMEQGAFALSPDKAVAIEAACKMIRKHKKACAKAWAELPGQLGRRFETKRAQR